MANKTKVENFKIKVPVFVSERVEQTNEFLEITYEEVVDNIIREITKHNKSSISVSSNKRNKMIRSEIFNISHTIHKEGDTPLILLKFDAFNTNVEGCVVKNSEIVTIEKGHLLGSENYFVMLYPQIDGERKQSIFWIILIYDDPKKKSDDNIAAAKLLVGKVLKLSLKAVKLNKVIDEIKKEKLLTKIELDLTTVSYDESNLDAKFQVYGISNKITTKEHYTFEKMPFGDVEELINTKFDNADKKTLSIFSSQKKKYKITQKYGKNFTLGINDIVEQSFNEEIIFKKEEEINLYKEDFVKDKLLIVLNQFLLSDVN